MLNKKMFLLECQLTGREYYDANDVWEDLKVGTVVQLVRQPENLQYPNAIAVVLPAGRRHDYGPLLGYLPANESALLAAFIDMGWTNLFECRISKINPAEDYDQQIRLTVRVTPNNDVR